VPLDPTISLGIKTPEAPDMLGMAGKMLAIQGAANQNKLFGQEFAARSAIGPLYQKAIDPATGQLDTNKLLAAAAQNPDTAWMAGDLAKSALERQGQEVTISGQQLDQSLKHLAAVRSSLGSLLAKKDATPEDAVSAVMELVGDGKNGVLSPKDGVTALTDMPRNDPVAFKSWLTNHFVNSMDAEQKMQAVWGSPQTISAGGKTYIMRVSPNPDVKPTEAGEVLNTLSPGERAAPRPTFANGQPGSVPTSAVVDDFGNPRTAGAAPAAGGVPTFGAPSAPGGGQDGAPAGFLPSGPKIGASAAADVTGSESAKQGIGLQTLADGVPQRKALLGNIEGALSQFTAGPASDWTRVAKTIANQGVVSMGGQPVFDPSKIASQEEFNKQAVQLAQSQFQALGGTGTDAKLNSTMHTSPNSALSNLGNSGIIAMLKGNEDAIAVKNQAWQTWLGAGHGPETYGQFSAQFNKVYDPRAFQFQYLSPADQAKARKGMTATEQKQFGHSMDLAKELGWIQ
jgi:hypothetical protein